MGDEDIAEVLPGTGCLEGRQRSARRHWFRPSGPVSKRRSLGSVRPRFGVFGPTIHEESRQAVSAKPERHYSHVVFESESPKSSLRLFDSLIGYAVLRFQPRC